MYEQMSLFDLLPKESDFPCHDCVFSQKGTCAHIESADCFCVRGSFQVKHSQIICPHCGKQMEVVQDDFSSDWARCKCGTVKIFKNKGNRSTAIELFRRGELIGR